MSVPNNAQNREGTVTPRDLVRLIKPEATDAEADFLLWERSCFPLGTTNQWLRQVRDAVKSPKSDRQVESAMVTALVACPFCDAACGEPCNSLTGGYGRAGLPHKARVRAVGAL